MKTEIRKKIIQIVKRLGIVRPRDMDEYGIHRKYIHMLYNQGVLNRIGRGLYTLLETEPSENRSIAEACKRMPSGVICLLSALRFHDLTTQSPYEIWMAIDNKARSPRELGIPIRIARFSGKALTSGIKEHNIEGVTIRVYNPAKTVADCFKFRNKIGLDVALEALRDCHRSRKCTMDDLWKYAKICRVANIMKPYLESLV
ncbi:MAG: type IV toxin-antitoxin system AbiEi family antitoxin domain-containing protein [candidate division Zixibacteria bacterium]|nr:type IV toxin-antitoxin system AbiEi family antitoxin domain-containing protein [candidate division Zixibacteria bacterium]